MKKTVLLLFCILLMASSLFANDFLDSFKDENNFIPDRLQIATGNDKYDFGITRNDDDQLSYSFDAKVEAPLWYMAFDAYGITNRGWIDGWNIQDHNQTASGEVLRGRYDSIETVFGMKLRPVEGDFYLHFYPEVGVAIVGDAGWVWGQNAIHRVAKIHEVDLPYDNPGRKDYRLMLDGRVNIGYKVFGLQRTNVIAEVEASSKNILGFQSENQILARISVSSLTHDLFGFHVGYMAPFALSDDASYTQKLYLQYLEGFRCGFTFDSGVFSMKYTGTPMTGYGYGSVAINVMGLFEPKTWAWSDYYIRFAKATMYGSFYSYISAEVNLDDNVSVVLKNSFLGGNPLNANEEKNADLNKSSRVKRAYSSFSLGLRYTWNDILKEFVYPYLEMGAGLQRYSYYSLDNQLENRSEGEKRVPSNDFSPAPHYYPLLNLEAGLTLLPENLLIVENTSLQLEVFAGTNILFGNTANLSKYKYIHKAWTTGDDSYLEDKGISSCFIPYVGLAFKFGFDL